MRRYALTGLLFGASLGIAAAQQPQMTWEGEVTGPTRLVIERDRVDVSGNSNVLRPSFRFYEQMPDRATNVTAEIGQGRGTVRVVEQPYRENGFRTVLALNPRGQREFMRVNVFWETRGNRGPGSVFGNDQYGRGSRNRRGDAGAGSMRWSGQVDQEAVIEVRGNRIVERTLRGRPVYRQDFDILSPLPRTDTTVNLVDAQGRGRIDVVQQPSASNGYVAAVRIVDPDSGAGDYAFTLNWDDRIAGRSSSVQSGSSPVQMGSGRAVFAAQVDGRIRVTMQGGRYSVDVLSGAPPRNVRVNFDAALPASPVNVDIDRTHGRDEVRLIQRPDRSNGYRLVFEIDDESGGYDNYEVEVKW